ncbi:tetratricopeptide repeat protein [Geomonas agri]|uniref:tetratricopeptide repeat protein n=1 Tax=Geomonas agri TaxID=2873702 RepID=UPI001CD67461|nr:tetratricopeptide repeat protein [Geomonas agri]
MTASDNIPHNSNSQLWQPLLILLAATLLVYAVSINNGFVLDDEVIIVNNPQTLTLRSIPDVLLSPDVVKPYYRPLNRATYLLDYQLAGMNPAWYHGVNIIIHLGNVILLYLVCRRFLADPKAALIAALLFAVHPVNTEAVNFISARNTLLALFFSLASLLAFVKARERGLRLPLLSALLFFCTLLSKETGLMLIAVIAIYCLVALPGQEDDRRPWRERLLTLVPFLFATLAYFALRSYSLHGMVGTTVPAEGLLSRLAINYYIVPQYLTLLLFPSDLTIFHTVPKGGLFASPWFLPAWAALLTAICLMVRSRNRVALFGLAWVLINYVPISNIVPIPSDPVNERFLYLPAIGFFMVVGALAAWVRSTDKARLILSVVVATLVAASSAVTVQRNREWKDYYSLAASGVKNNPGSAEAHYHLGTALKDKGDLEAARREWESALRIDPANSDSLTQMGTLAAMKGDLRSAERYYAIALLSPNGKADPYKAMAHFNLGKIYEIWGLPQKALQQYEQFMQVVPMTYLEYKTDGEQRIARLRRALSGAPTR